MLILVKELVITVFSSVAGDLRIIRTWLLAKMTVLHGIFMEGEKGLFSQVAYTLKVYCMLMVVCLVLLDLPVFCNSASAPDIEGEALVDLLNALNDSSHRISDWNFYIVSPCNTWSHVTCSNGNVVSLNLASNGFSGSLSPSITRLKYLVSLELQNNQLSGALPDYIGNMEHLQTLNLANNSFSGSIPKSWGQLSSLKHLVISNNNLKGFIPDSFSSITGLAEFFEGNHLDCGSSLQQPCVSSPIVPASNGKSKLGLSLGAAGGSALSLAIVAIFVYLYRRVHEKHDIFVDVAAEDECKVSYGQLKKFSWRELQLATDNFSENNVIGQGGFGKVYKGVLLDRRVIAVKRLIDYHNPGGEAAFHREVELISVAVHRNLLRLIGFCTTASERILVYPFMKNLSVAYRLRDLKPGENGLDWATRKHVAFGIAHGLEYLHDHCDPKIIHRDLKTANILLDDEFEAVLGDFGLAKVVDTKLTHVTTQVRGTMGHIAPEYLSTGKSSEKTDVFGYGITLLELVTGQRAIDFSRLEEEEDVLLLDHIKKLLREKRLQDIVDRNLKAEYDPTEVETIVRVALLCTQSSPEERPKMAEVVNMLQGEGLAERWAEWEQLEVIRNQEYLVIPHRLNWDADSTVDQEAIQLSEAR
ncbi:hypothetical protein Scep_018872 [Stephania cephalantha]|uniref:non-specific serine/threonine protein kinase n=1 Tax=Stephania cephalantha TaxID=152367 RepID=A0AAP0NLM2_9MAGN